MSKEPESTLDQLAARAAGGDREAFRELALAIGPAAHAAVWRLVGRQQLAADAVQEFLIKLLQVLPRYDTGRPFWPWARTVAVRTAADLLRKERSWRELPLDQAPELAAPREHGPDRRHEADELTAAIRQAARRLPDQQRVVFVLRDVEGWTVAEVAEQLGMAASTVRVHLARARRKLRLILQENLETTTGDES